MTGSAGGNGTPFFLVCVLIYTSSLRGGRPSSIAYMCFTLSTKIMQHVCVLNKTQIQSDIPFYALIEQSSCCLMYDVWSTLHGWLCHVLCEPMTKKILNSTKSLQNSYICCTYFRFFRCPILFQFFPIIIIQSFTMYFSYLLFC